MPTSYHYDTNQKKGIEIKKKHTIRHLKLLTYHVFLLHGYKVYYIS